jgi:hypothetical protein
MKEKNMKNKYLSLLLVAVAIIAVQCTKEGPEAAVGPQGVVGPTGLAGAQGATGAQGVQGPNGATGPQGPQGAMGPVGAQGASGAQGPSGVQGPSGPQGPAGPTGPVGPTGPTGPQGPTGPAGIPGGAANAIYSNWATLQQAWRDTTIDGSALKVNHAVASSLTPNLINQGIVLAYFQIPGDVNFFELPYTSNAGGIANTMSYIPATGKIFYTRFTHNNSGSIGVSSSLRFRWIAIPGGFLGGRNASATVANTGLTIAQIRALPYSQVCRLFNIPQ